MVNVVKKHVWYITFKNLRSTGAQRRAEKLEIDAFASTIYREVDGFFLGNYLPSPQNSKNLCL